MPWQRRLHLTTRIGAVGEQFPEKGKQTEQGRQQRETAVAILNVGGGDDAVQQQALRIDQNMPLLALDQLAGIEAVAVDATCNQTGRGAGFARGFLAAAPHQKIYCGKPGPDLHQQPAFTSAGSVYRGLLPSHQHSRLEDT